MVAPFPVVKLGALLIKQVSKPLASFVKSRALKNPFLRNYVLLPPAQFYHWCDVRMKMYLSNIIRTKDSVPIPKLNEQAAIELGANLLGEFIIIMVASTILVWEYNRQKEKENTKEDEEQQFINNLEQRITDIGLANEELDARLRELTRLVYATPAIMRVASQPEPTEGRNPVMAEDAVTRALSAAKIKLRSG